MTDNRINTTILNTTHFEAETEQTVSDKFQKALIPAAPYIEDNFLGHIAEDIRTILNTPRLWPLTGGAAVGGAGLGAHDFANSMGTTVGAQVLTFGEARAVAGLMMLYGATFGGKKTAESVKSNVWDVRETSLEASDIQNGMSAALLGSGLWIALTIHLGYPISTTQSTLGGIMGVGAVADAIKTNDYNNVLNGVKLDNLKKYVEAWGVSIGGGIAGGAAVYGLGLRWIYHFTEFNPVLERVWHILPVVSGALVAYGIGCNDTGHVIGPLAGGIDANKLASSRMTEESHVNQWLNILGAWFVTIGMWNWGGNMTDTLGSKLGGMNPAKAVSAELTTYLLLNYFKSQGIPVSSSQTIVSAVVGVMVGSGNIPPPFFFGRMVGAWAFSIPLSALFAGTGYAAMASLSAIDRDAPAKDPHGAGLFEGAAIPLMRADRPFARLAAAAASDTEGSLMRLGGRLGRRIPLGAIGLGMLIPAVLRAGEEGPIYAGAEIAKTGIELMPIGGGIFQAADGVYELIEGKSYITNLEASSAE